MKSFKYILLLFTTIITLSSTLIPSPASASGFRDVDASKYEWAMESIDFMIDHQIVNGFPDGSFKPKQALTKAEFTVMIHRLFPQLRATEPQSIQGVSPNHWAHQEFSDLYSDIGIYAADQQNFNNETYTYSPDKKMTRWDVLIVLNALFEDLGGRTEPTQGQLLSNLNYIKDVQMKKFASYDQYDAWKNAYSPLTPIIGTVGTDNVISQDLEWLKANALYTFQTQGIMTADNQGNFHPLQQVTRAEIVTILHRLYLIAGENYAPTPPVTDPIPGGTKHFIYGSGESTGSGHNLFYNDESIDFTIVLNNSLVEGEPIKKVVVRVESQQILDVYVTVNNEKTLYTYEQLTDPINPVRISVEGLPYIMVESKTRFPEQLTENGDNDAMVFVES
ncbi:S-layer homology domain-containing protein [Paenibacillus sp. FSL K6-2524]|uniref:S-layer homology domain-containing protein n=1 Tax=Paenibacillus sp. FSL K6-2524 TaxID=2954516 RepID=UPI0030F51038